MTGMTKILGEVSAVIILLPYYGILITLLAYVLRSVQDFDTVCQVD